MSNSLSAVFLNGENMNEEVWIICQDYGYEGLHEPFKAYTTLEKAEKALRIMFEMNSYSLKLVKAELVE